MRRRDPGERISTRRGTVQSRRLAQRLDRIDARREQIETWRARR